MIVRLNHGMMLAHRWVIRLRPSGRSAPLVDDDSLTVVLCDADENVDRVLRFTGPVIRLHRAGRVGRSIMLGALT